MEHEVTFEGFKTIELPNIPIMQANLPEPVMTYLWQLIDVAKANPKDLKGGLAGNISTSFELHDEQNIFETFCVPSLLSLDEKVGRGWHPLNSGHKYNYKLTNLWVNYQRQTEFNPVHDHGGSYSFVVWMKIPTSNKEQRELPIAKESLNGDSISNFAFLYNDVIGNIRSLSIPMEKETAGSMVIFPSRMKHQVYPFYECDEERVSVAGNFGVIYE